MKVSKTEAIALDYNGCGEIGRIEAFDSDRPIFYVTGKRFDIEAVREEVKSESVTVYLKPLLDSVAKVDSLLNLAVRSGGVYQRKVGGV